MHVRSAAVAAAFAAIVAGAPGCGASAAPPPPQPLAFSHKQHVTDNEIGCAVCHPYGRHSPAMGLAPVSTCVGCHKFVAKEKPEIIKLMAEVSAGRPLQWTRVHRVPDHVFFSHERHLAKGVECRTCHGDVAAMTLDHQVQPFNMGFCMECHRANKASIECIACHK